MRNHLRHVEVYLRSLVVVLWLLAASDAMAEEAVRGLVKPRNQAVVSSQTDGRVVKLAVRAGDSFNKGDLLIAFDCSMFEARLEAAKAEHRARRATHESNLELEALDSIPGYEVALSKAAAEKASAEEKIARVQVSRCEVRAPYAGRVIDTQTHLFETVAANQELLTILDRGPLEIELIVPSKYLTWLEVGTPLGFAVDETGARFEAKVSRIAASADPVSQTVRLDAVFDAVPTGVVSGMSGTALLRRSQAPAAPR